MPEARLHLTVPESVWVGKLTRDYPDATISVLAAMANGDSAGVGLAEIRHSALDSLLADMRDADGVQELTVLNDPGERALVQFETTAPLLLMAAQDSGVPLEMPFDLSDGTVTWELTAPRDRLSELGVQLRGLGIPFTIDYIQEEITNENLLTDAQNEIISLAIDHGYYDTPRDCSLTELAGDVDRAKSTVSETLHRAESKIIKQYAEEDRPTDEPQAVTIAQ